MKKHDQCSEPLKNGDALDVEFQVKHPERGTWQRQLDFTLSLIGYSVGLGNIWRFPYVCMRNGGGAFLIPYFLFLFICGLPLFFLELSIGQFSSLSPLSVWKLAPLFKGLGWAMVLVSGIVAIYYNIIITWTLYYLGKSFTSHLPWSDCDNVWNTPRCLDNLTRSNNTFGNASIVSMTNMTAEEAHLNLRTPGEEFWQEDVLELTSGMHDLGGIRWQLALCLLFSWVIIFLCIFKGVHSTGKVVYVTATVPYLFLTMLLIRGALLPGALDGILFYIKPDFTRLLEFQTWGDACLQIFYSLGPGWGGLITMASYNKFHNNCLRDSIMVCLTCSGTSLYAGFVIFSIIGYMAQAVGRPVSSVISSGPGLAFIVYPEAIAKLPISPLWSICFFLMLLTLGLDTQFGMVETLISGVIDQYPRQLRPYKVLFSGLVCVIAFCIGLTMVTRGGMYIFQIVDWYSASCSLVLIGVMESLVLSWVYGLERLYKDIEMMLGFRPSSIWKVFWAVISPSILSIVFVYNFAVLKPPSYGSYEYPSWAQGIGWVIALTSVVPIPGYMMVALYREQGTLRQRVSNLIRPSPDWGPADPLLLAKYKTAQQDVSWRAAENSHDGAVMLEKQAL